MPDAGLVPASTASNALQFLRGDGKWADSTKGLVKLKQGTKYSSGSSRYHYCFTLPDGYDWKDVNGIITYRADSENESPYGYGHLYFVVFDYNNSSTNYKKNYGFYMHGLGTNPGFNYSEITYFQSSSSWDGQAYLFQEGCFLKDTGEFITGNTERFAKIEKLVAYALM